MNVILCQSPFWTVDFVPLNLPVIAAALKSTGMNVNVLDLNKSFHASCTQYVKSSWLNPCSWWDKRYIATVLHHCLHQIEHLANEATRSGSLILWTMSGPQVKMSQEIIRRLREEYHIPNTIAIGGPHCILSGTEGWDEWVDFIGIGEIEVMLDDLLALYRSSERPVILKTRKRAELDALHTPSFEEICVADYPNSVRINYMASRGCRNRCVFCSEGMLFGKVRYRSADLVVSDIIRIADSFRTVEGIRFHDSALNSDQEEFSTLVASLVSLGIPWGANFIAESGLADNHLCRQLVSSGCVFASMGLESASNHILDQMGKKFSVELITRVVRTMADHGIAVSINLMPGFPGETEQEHQKTMEWIAENASYLHSLTISPVGMKVADGSLIARHPARYGISETSADQRDASSEDHQCSMSHVRSRRARQLYLTAIDNHVGIARPGDQKIITSEPMQMLPSDA